MESNHFQYKISGEGHKVCLAFPGYGQGLGVYDELINSCKDIKWVVINISTDTYNGAICKEDFFRFLDKEIDRNTYQELILLSYSLGSRFALTIVENFPQRVRKVILIAPEGVRISRWNYLATFTRIGNYIFRIFVYRENAYKNSILFLRRAGLISKSFATFSLWHMRNPVERKRVYMTWQNMKYFIPDMKKISVQVRQHSMDIFSFFGKHDRIIRRNVYQRCIRYFPAGKHKLLDEGHDLLKKKLFSEIKEII